MKIRQKEKKKLLWKTQQQQGKSVWLPVFRFSVFLASCFCFHFDLSVRFSASRISLDFFFEYGFIAFLTFNTDYIVYYLLASLAPTLCIFQLLLLLLLPRLLRYSAGSAPSVLLNIVWDSVARRSSSTEKNARAQPDEKSNRKIKKDNLELQCDKFLTLIINRTFDRACCHSLFCSFL